MRTNRKPSFHCDKKYKLETHKKTKDLNDKFYEMYMNKNTLNIVQFLNEVLFCVVGAIFQVCQ